MGLGENFFWGSDQTTGTTGTTGSGWLSLFWLFRTACYLNSAPWARAYTRHAKKTGSGKRRVAVILEGFPAVVNGL